MIINTKWTEGLLIICLGDVDGKFKDFKYKESSQNKEDVPPLGVSQEEQGKKYQGGNCFCQEYDFIFSFKMKDRLKIELNGLYNDKQGELKLYIQL